MSVYLVSAGKARREDEAEDEEAFVDLWVLHGKDQP